MVAPDGTRCCAACLRRAIRSSARAEALHLLPSDGPASKHSISCLSVVRHDCRAHGDARQILLRSLRRHARARRGDSRQLSVLWSNLHPHG